MEKCSNCGGAVRPGAKFCTSCGTRLNNDVAAVEAGWSQETSATETQVATPAVQPEVIAESAEPATATTSTEDDEAGSSQFSTWRRGSNSWGTSSETSSSPADRFEAALDDEPTSAPEMKDASPESSSMDWGKPAAAPAAAAAPAPESTEDRFASWAAAYSSSTGDTDSDDAAVESATITPAGAEETADVAGSGDPTVDYLSGDETIAPAERDVVITPGTTIDPSDVRERATALVEELRGLIWKIGEADSTREGDSTDVLNGLTGVRGQTSDFTDLEGVITAVRESPRDIDALRELGKQAERLESLLESHASLTAAVDDAIRKLR